MSTFKFALALARHRMLRYSVIAICLMWLRNKILRIMRWLRETKRRRDLLLKLPGPKSDRLHFLGNLTGMVPADQPMNAYTVNKYFVKQLGKTCMTEELRDEGLCCLWVLNDKIPLHNFGSVFVYNIDLARQLLSSKSLDKWEKGYSYKVSRPLIGHGALGTSGPEWSRQRPLLEKGFKKDILVANMDAIFTTASEHCEKVGRWADSCTQGAAVVNAFEELLKVTLDVLGRVAFSYDIGSVTAPTTADAPLYHAFENILTTLEERIRNPLSQALRSLPLNANLNFNRDIHKLDSIVDNIISEREADKLNGIKRNRHIDLLDVLLAGLTEEEEERLQAGKMSRQTMIDNVKTMLFAGHDTTASASTWFLYLLAKHPEAQEKLLAEAKEYLGEDFGTRVPALDTLEVMPYLNSVVLEVLRMYPSAAFTRMAKEDINLGKHVIPKGAEVLVFPYYIHRDPRNFEDPDSFKPERWAENKTGSEQLSLQAQLARETKAKAFLPFSLGARSCVGRALALVEIRVLVLKIISEFQVKLPTKEQLNKTFPQGYDEFQEWPSMSLTLNPKGVNVVYERRK